MNKRWGLAIAVTVLVLLAGCSGALSQEDEPAPTVDERTDTPTPTPTAEPVDPDNPYEKRTLKIRVSYSAEADTPRRSELQDAFEYWEEHAEAYLGYPVRFEITDSWFDADIKLRFAARIKQCGLTIDLDKTNDVGCAPLVDSPQDTGDVDMTIDNTLISNSTTEVLKHEFGHVLGLDHDDSPAGVMNETTEAVPMEKTILYSASIDSSYDEEDIDRQLEGVEEYVQNGSDGTLKTDITMKRTGNKSKAFIHFDISGDRDACDDGYVCTLDNYECANSFGCMKVDEEFEELEASYTITTGDIKPDYVAYAAAFELHNSVFYRHYYLKTFPDRLMESSDAEFDEEWWM